VLSNREPQQVTETRREEHDLPPPVLEAVTALWDAKFEAEAQAIASGRFRMLSHICSSVYPEIPGSRLSKAPTGDFARRELGEALRNFFRWIGAPWYREDHCMTPEQAAGHLHRSFLQQEVQLTYLAPLDRLGLEDTTKRPHDTLYGVRFGNCEIRLLDRDRLVQRVPVKALGRFETRCWFPSEQLAGFYYLIARTKEPAGPSGTDLTFGALPPGRNPPETLRSNGYYLLEFDH